MLLLNKYRVHENECASGDIMNQWVDSSSLQYAVIEALRTGGRPESVVIAYRDEESLRDLIAAPSIVAVGFSSRQQAAASTEVYGSAAVTSKRSLRAGVVDAAGKCERRSQSAERRFEDWFGLGQTGEIGRRILRDVVAAAIRIFNSRNDISAAIRFALGSSM